MAAPAREGPECWGGGVRDRGWLGREKPRLPTKEALQVTTPSPTTAPSPPARLSFCLQDPQSCPQKMRSPTPHPHGRTLPHSPPLHDNNADTAGGKTAVCVCATAQGKPTGQGGKPMKIPPQHLRLLPAFALNGASQLTQNITPCPECSPFCEGVLAGGEIPNSPPGEST